jgi:hypothetical protein
MKTLFLNGLMPERHGQFIRFLGRRHRITGTRLESFRQETDLNLIPFPQDLSQVDQQRARELQRRLVEDTASLAEHLAADANLATRAPVASPDLDPETVEKILRPRVAQVLLVEAAFEAFADREPLDMVISGSDYASHARGIALAARRRKIPTLDLEHGFFFNNLTPDYLREDGNLPIFFTSEFVNLDNDLEVELTRGKLALFPDQGNTFLGLGTPIHSVANPGLSRQEARTRLELDTDRTVVAIMGSWNEARSVQKLLSSQMETIAAFDALLGSLATRPSCGGIQLVIKLHPADARAEVLPHVAAGLQEMARSHGLPHPLIKADSLPEVISSADVILAMGDSSILFDAYQLGKPSVVLYPPTPMRFQKPGWQERSTMPLLAGVSTATRDPDEAWAMAEAWLTPERQEQFARNKQEFSARYGLEFRTVEEKSERVLRWIEDHLESRAEP